MWPVPYTSLKSIHGDRLKQLGIGSRRVAEFTAFSPPLRLRWSVQATLRSVLPAKLLMKVCNDLFMCLKRRHTHAANRLSLKS